ncbi:MAG: hypothetical protein GTO14_25510 [Anaerolineales bacterium]|nr:hypothetical protein [Anaerolineales bacterium]
MNQFRKDLQSLAHERRVLQFRLDRSLNTHEVQRLRRRIQEIDERILEIERRKANERLM